MVSVLFFCQGLHVWVVYNSFECILQLYCLIPLPYYSQTSVGESMAQVGYEAVGDVVCLFQFPQDSSESDDDDDDDENDDDDGDDRDDQGQPPRLAPAIASAQWCQDLFLCTNLLMKDKQRNRLLNTGDVWNQRTLPIALLRATIPNCLVTCVLAPVWSGIP